MKLDFLLQSSEKHTESVLNEKAFSPFARGTRSPILRRGHSQREEGSGVEKVLEKTWQPPLLRAAAAVGAHTNQGLRGHSGLAAQSHGLRSVPLIAAGSGPRARYLEWRWTSEQCPLLCRQRGKIHCPKTSKQKEKSHPQPGRGNAAICGDLLL